MGNGVYLVIAGVLTIGFLFMTFWGGKTKKYRVVSSQPDPQTGGLVIEVLYRGSREKWNDAKDMRCYRNGEGKKVLLGVHWIIRIEEM